MPENPYEPAHTASAPPKKSRPGRWLVWAGVASIVLAVVGVVVSVLGMMLAFDTAAGSSSVSPSGLAGEIKWATIPGLAALPLGAAGIVLLVVGVILWRRGG